MTPWRIGLLGGLRAERDGRLLTRFPTRKAASLLAFLAYHSRRSHSRDALIDLLWPDLPPPSARNSLSKALSSLRRLLEQPEDPSPFLLADHASIQLDPARLSTDVADFDAALAAADAASGHDRTAALIRALSLYKGHLLPDFCDAWLLPERAWLAERCFRALDDLLARLEARGDAPRAIEHARRGVALDPLREETHRALIRLLIATGQAPLARRQYEELERRLRDELGAAPTEETRELLTRLDRPSAPGPTLAPSPLAPSPSPRLPAPLTRFFGREAEIDALGRMLTAEQRRLVTLTGPGGSGKTRLALEVARRLAPAWNGAVAFVSLATLPDGDRLPEAIREALGLPPAPHVAPREQLVAALEARPTLLVLDNLEHLLDRAAPFVAELLERVPALTCLVTSRERLRLWGERRFPVAPLPIPPAADVPGAGCRVPREETPNPTPGRQHPARLLVYPSVQLFLDRAQAVAPAFELTSANAGEVAALCARLEGLPLSIELAAARSGSVSPGQMVRELEDRFGVLVSGFRDGEARHRSLWATLEWSYRLLPGEIQRFFAGLSVFRGGWMVEAAAAVSREERAGEYLERLRECSLVEVEGEERRWRMLETLREFAAEQLLAVEAEAIQRRHLEFFLALAEHAQPEARGPGEVQWLEKLEQEHANLRTALDASPRMGEAVLGLRLAVALSWFWESRAYFSEGQSYLDRLLSQAGSAPPTRLRAQALAGSAYLAYRQGDLGAATRLEELALSTWHELDDLQGIARSLNLLALIAEWRGEYARAMGLLEETLRLCTESDNASGVRGATHNMGVVARKKGDYARAWSLHQTSLALAREADDQRGIAYDLDNLGLVAEKQEEYPTARSFLRQSLSVHHGVGDKLGIARCLKSLGRVEAAAGDGKRAALLYGAGLALFDAIGVAWDRADIAECERRMDRVRADLGMDAYEAALAAGRAMPLEAAITLALGEETKSGTR